jgi:hypothetical protein
MSHGDYPPIKGLDDRQTKAYWMLRENDGTEVDAVAEAVGVDRRTIFRWKKHDAWVSADNVWMRAAAHTAKQKLAGFLNEGVDVLIGIARDSVNDPGVRLRAVAEAFDRGGLPASKEVAIDHSGSVGVGDTTTDLAAINADLATLDAE